jgi:hypothetical protein
MFINNEISFVYDKPAKYKDLTLYPVTVENAMEFDYYVGCLLVDKNSIPDVNIISMTYLDYLIKSTNEDNFYYHRLIGLLNLCAKPEERVGISEEEAKDRYNSGKDVLISKTENPETDSIEINNEKGIAWDKAIKLIKTSVGRNPFYFKEDKIYPFVKNGKTFIQIKDQFYTTTDFDNIKKIILDQNDVEQFDEKMRKSIRDDLEERRRIANKIKGTVKFCNFEEQMICLSIALCISLEEVKKMTLRKFKKYIARINHKMDYEIMTVSYSAAGVDGKKTPYPEHWMSDLNEKNKYSGITMSEEDLKNKVK